MSSSSDSDSEPEQKPVAKAVPAAKKADRKPAKDSPSDDEDVQAKWAPGDRKPTVHRFALLEPETGYIGPRNVDLDCSLDYFRLYLTSEMATAIVQHTNDFGQRIVKRHGAAGSTSISMSLISI